MTITVTANGDPIALDDGALLPELLTRLELGERWVVVERNGEPVDRPDMADTALADGDRLEIVRAVAGG